MSKNNMGKFTIKLKNGSTITIDTDLPEEEKLKGFSTKLLNTPLG